MVVTMLYSVKQVRDRLLNSLSPINKGKVNAIVEGSILRFMIKRDWPVLPEKIRLATIDAHRLNRSLLLLEQKQIVNK
jgi:hypothetical protein